MGWEHGSPEGETPFFSGYPSPHICPCLPTSEPSLTSNQSLGSPCLTGGSWHQSPFPDPQGRFDLGAVLGAVPEQSSSVCCAASDHHGSSFPVPSPDCLSSRFSFLALLSPFCCGFLLSWEPEDHGSAGGMCCSAQLLGADRVGGGVVLLFFSDQRKIQELLSL